MVTLNPYEPPPESRTEPSRSWHLPRYLAFALTLVFIILPTCGFTYLVRGPIEHKMAVFGEMLTGPFGALFVDSRFGFNPIESICITLLVLAYTIYPRWITFFLTILGTLLWTGCGIVHVTGGV
jgi:hypothetical protein